MIFVCKWRYIVVQITMYVHINWSHRRFNMLITYLCVGDEDYEIQNYNPVFYPGETKHTLLLDLVDDDIVEDNEFYFLNISESLPQHVTVGRYPSTKIIIQDDDSKLHIPRLLYDCLHAFTPLQCTLI